jgi:uncharacterized RDD family membrane protein YckC
MPDHTTRIESTPCGLGRRLLVIAYDGLIVTALLLLATAVALPLEFLGQQALRDPWLTLYLGFVWFLYEAWCWRRAGMTLGMRAWQVRLVTDDGGRLGWGRCLLRFLAGIVGAAALGAGLLWALVDAQKRCWHDLVAGTRLLRAETASDRSP